MNYLQLAQRIRQECSGANTSGPSTVLNQTGQLKKYVDWVADAWTELQQKYPDWRWMRSSFTVETVIGDSTYAYGDCTDIKTNAAIDRFSHWWWQDRRYPFRVYKQSDGVATEQWIYPLDLMSFKRQYRIGSIPSYRPAHYTIDEDNNIVLGPAPDAVYVVSGDYQRGPQVLAADADTPDMPSQSHMLIVYRAMEKYAGDSVAAEVMQRATREGGKLLRALEWGQRPQMEQAEPLA